MELRLVTNMGSCLMRINGPRRMSESPDCGTHSDTIIGAWPAMGWLYDLSQLITA